MLSPVMLILIGLARVNCDMVPLGDDSNHTTGHSSRLVRLDGAICAHPVSPQAQPLQSVTLQADKMVETTSFHYSRWIPSSLMTYSTPMFSKFRSRFDTALQTLQAQSAVRYWILKTLTPGDRTRVPKRTTHWSKSQDLIRRPRRDMMIFWTNFRLRSAI